MASPPNNYGSARSPLSPPQITIPNSSKKRPSDMMPTSAPAVKRRKQSMLSNTSSNHPLRQTSFPPDDAGQGARYSPSPSVDNMSMVSSSTKRGVQSKKSLGKRRAVDDDDTSLVSGQGGGLLSVGNGRGKRVKGSRDPSRGPSTGVDAEDDDDEGDDEVAMELTKEVTKFDNSAKAVQARNYEIREAMDVRQQERFDAWHASRLSNAVVKKVRSYPSMNSQY